MNKLNGGSLTPAYGRDYKNKRDAEMDFLTGKDWVYHGIDGSGYCSVDDFTPGCSVQLRYKQSRMVTVVKVPKDYDEKCGRIIKLDAGGKKGMKLALARAELSKRGQ